LPDNDSAGELDYRCFFLKVCHGRFFLFFLIRRIIRIPTVIRCRCQGIFIFGEITTNGMLMKMGDGKPPREFAPGTVCKYDLYYLQRKEQNYYRHPKNAEEWAENNRRSRFVVVRQEGNTVFYETLSGLTEGSMDCMNLTPA